MSKLFVAIICILSFQVANAQTFKVVKIAGKKAIVEVDDTRLINVNQTYSVGGQSLTSNSSVGIGKRDHAIGLDFSYISQSSPSVSTLSFGGTYLWNLKQYEFGPVVALENSSGGSGSSTTTTTFGGMGFYNLNENKPGVETVLSGVGKLTFRSGSGSSITHLEAGGNYRWFLLSGDHCFSGSLVYYMNQSSGSNTSGFLLSGGIITYF